MIDYSTVGISPAVQAYGEKKEAELTARFAAIDRVAEANQLKVLAAMQKNRLAEAHLGTSTGYGYNDAGRDTLAAVYADTFHTEAALVRPQITCGTHALTVGLWACLHPGDEILSAVGKPYDTLEEVIGIRPSAGSLAEYGITYAQADPDENGDPDIPAIVSRINERTRLVEIQRSRGYSSRPTLSCEKIGQIIAAVKAVKPDVICMVDNCYGEFAEEIEPSDVGADLVVGSLIKNPGGGLASTGGYLAGRQDIIDRCAYRLNAPGLGAEVGASLGLLPSMFQGFFLAPTVTASAIKGAVFAASCFEGLGFEVIPRPETPRYDIIQQVILRKPELLVAFCRGIQAAAPVDSFVAPEPWDMPGYDAPVIMAAGAFVQGSSIELSADGPLKEPYSVFFQGGLTWYHAKTGVLMAVQKLVDEGLTLC